MDNIGSQEPGDRLQYWLLISDSITQRKMEYGKVNVESSIDLGPQSDCNDQTSVL
jgi:hypothetical protein